jgi:hypothetical protein
VLANFLAAVNIPAVQSVTFPTPQGVECKGATSDTTIQTFRVDAATHVIKTIDYAHSEVHGGSSFYYHDVIALGNGASQDYLLTVPNTAKWPHFGLSIDGNDAGVTVEIYEATDRTGTTLQTVFNRNRNSTVAATTTVHKGQSGGTTDGTRIYWKRAGTRNISSSAGTAEERILKRNTKYIVRVTNLSTSTNNVSTVLRWYEHTNKTA